MDNVPEHNANQIRHHRDVLDIGIHGFAVRIAVSYDVMMPYSYVCSLL